MNFWKNKKGMSLVETLVGISIFTIVAVISANILVSIAQFEKRSSIQNAIFEDMRAILQQLTNEIQNGTIDYEEYYNVCVINNSCDPAQVGYSPESFYGINYGVYGSRFYDPGQSLAGGQTLNPDDLGVECSYEDPDTGECEVIYVLSADANTGQNPFLGAAPAGDASAFCEGARGACSAAVNDGNSVMIDQLFLLDETGTKKTILGRKKVRDISGGGFDWAIGKVVMNGEDFDQNGLVDVFLCAHGYECEDNDIADDLPQLDVFVGDKTGFIATNEISLPQKSDLSSAFYTGSGTLAPSQFVPITPLRSSVQSLQFVITPIEDPYKAFSETAMQSHPTVNIILTLGLSSETAKDYPGVFEPITVQTTVAAGVVGRIDSYPPVDDVRVGGVSWLSNILPALATTSL